MCITSLDLSVLRSLRSPQTTKSNGRIIDGPLFRWTVTPGKAEHGHLRRDSVDIQTAQVLSVSVALQRVIDEA